MRTVSTALLLSGIVALAACTQSPGPLNSAEGAPEGSIHNMPVPTAVQSAKDALAERLGVDVSTVVVLEATEREWSDSCLGLGGPAESCLQAITPGYAVLLVQSGTEYRYRTNDDGSSVRAE